MQVASFTRAHTRLANNLAWTYLSISLFNNTHSEISAKFQSTLLDFYEQCHRSILMKIISVFALLSIAPYVRT